MAYSNPSSSIARVLLLALAPAVLAAVPHGAATAGPVRVPLAAPSATVEVENRFIPGFLRRGEDAIQQAQNDTALRLQQLEAQVRTLTGQVEELTFVVRQLQGGQGIPVGQPGATGQPGTPAAGLPNAPANAPQTGPGAPPAPLGQTPPSAPLAGNTGVPGATGTNDVASAPVEPRSGPLDLSILNQGLRLPGFGSRAEPSPEAPAAAPQVAANDPLASVRELQQSGRYGLAAQEARTLLNGNPSAPVAAEARFLLGEALLAQGDYRSAANYFLENYTADPNGNRGPESLLRLSTALNGLGENQAACSSLEELLGAYPNAESWVRAEAERQRQAANCT